MTGMEFTGYVRWGAELAEVMDSWLHREWAWVGCSLRDAASVFERWRWDLVTRKASVSELRSAFTCGCWHKSHHQTACALASLKARRGSLPQAIRSRLTTVVFRYLMRKCSLSEHRSMLPFKEDFLGTVFTFILIQVVENIPC